MNKVVKFMNDSCKFGNYLLLYFTFIVKMKRLFLVLFLLQLWSVRSQELELKLSESISDCTGASNILQSGTYSLEFTGKSGKINDFVAYPSLDKTLEKNSLWCSFKAPFKGRFTLDAIVADGELDLLIFETQSRTICNDILSGKAEVARIIKAGEKRLGLSLIAASNTLYPLELEAGKEIMICFLLRQKSKAKMDVQFYLEPIDLSNTDKDENSKVVDLRPEKFTHFSTIQLRDALTGNPVTAKMTISGMKSVAALYYGSDFYFCPEKSGKITISVDAAGYFFVDKEEPLSPLSDNEIIIWLEPLGTGKSLQIDNIDFIIGTTNYTPASEPKLRRLKEFLALNAGISIEIQGHVNETGQGTFDGKQISEARAKRVKKYLVENGINKDRLTTVGLGNTKPIYPNPKLASEEQANRRVEIKIIN
jgi:outer membrane protein OmpA-like peptidoglycan-associated protein